MCSHSNHIFGTSDRAAPIFFLWVRRTQPFQSLFYISCNHTCFVLTCVRVEYDVIFYMIHSCVLACLNPTPTAGGGVSLPIVLGLACRHPLVVGPLVVSVRTLRYVI